MTNVTHTPVLLRETLEILRPRAGGRYVDGTLGGGGHAEAILEASAPDGALLGIDRDGDACARSSRRLGRFRDRVRVRKGSFAEIGDHLRAIGWEGADGILIDLGVSSFHLDDPDRGFSFSRPGPLDMRLDPSEGVDVSTWLGDVDERELTRVLRTLGEEPRARRIARAILAARARGELIDTVSLANVVTSVTRRTRDHHPATRTFQALRIAINGELDVIERFLGDAWEHLRPGGRLIMIAYHSLEDRLVKRAFRIWASDCLCPRSVPVCRCGWSRKVVDVTRRPVRPSPEEIRENPRSRSARLRAVERVAA